MFLSKISSLSEILFLPILVLLNPLTHDFANSSDEGIFLPCECSRCWIFNVSVFLLCLLQAKWTAQVAASVAKVRRSNCRKTSSFTSSASSAKVRQLLPVVHTNCTRWYFYGFRSAIPRGRQKPVFDDETTRAAKR